MEYSTGRKTGKLEGGITRGQDVIDVELLIDVVFLETFATSILWLSFVDIEFGLEA